MTRINSRHGGNDGQRDPIGRRRSFLFVDLYQFGKRTLRPSFRLDAGIEESLIAMEHQGLISPASAPERLSDLLERRAAAMGQERVSVADMLELLEDRSIEGVLLLLSLAMALPIPAPGLSVPFGASLAIVSAQLALGRRRAWLPGFLSRRSLSRAHFTALIKRAIPLLRRLERFTRPRGTWFTRRWVSFPMGVVCLLLALIIALPIPLGNVVPGMAISLVSLGIVERDVLALCVGLAVSAAALLLVTIACLGVQGIFRNWQLNPGALP